MNGWRYLRDQALHIVCWIGCGWGCALYLRGLDVAPDAIAFVLIMIAAAGGAPLIADYLHRTSWYRQTQQQLEELDRPYLLHAVMEEPGFVDGQICYDWMDEVAHAMNERIAASERAIADYREYLELWVHEIKMPIATALLTAENHPSAEMRSIQQDLQRIESCVMQVLYYARSSTLEDDYIIAPTTLGALADAALKRNARQLIRAGFSIEKGEMDCTVRTDSKWMGFVLDQIIQNAIKYRNGEAPVLRVSASCGEQAAELLIEDNGVGVPEADLPRLFQKGFTGENGRRFTKATGMGLYIARNLLGKMNHGIRAEHGSDGGLLIRIRIPTGTLYDLT